MLLLNTSIFVAAVQASMSFPLEFFGTSKNNPGPGSESTAHAESDMYVVIYA